MRKSILVIGILAILCVRPAICESNESWVQIRSPHFTVITDSSAEQGRKIAAQFEHMRAFFHIVLPNAANDDIRPITVFALRDEKSFKAFEPARYLAKGQARLAGFFLRTEDTNYIVLQMDASFQHPYASIYHEYTHFILRKNYWLPLWLNEGVAQYYQNTDIESSEVAFGQPNFYAMHFISSRLKLLPLPELFMVDHNSPYYHEEDKTSVFYIESWALTHLLETADFQQKTHRLADYDEKLKSGEDPVVAAKHAFGDLDQLSHQLDNYVSQIGYQGTRIRVSLNFDASSFPTLPISPNDVQASRADVLLHDGDRQEAQTVLEAVLKSDPNNASAHERMGKLAAYSKDNAAARKWFEEAAQLNPSSDTAHYYAAQFERSDPKAAASVESHLRTCLQLNPNYAAAYNDLADLYLTQGKNLDEAHLLAIHAVQLEPQVLVFRVTTAQILEAQQNHSAALSVLDVARSQIARTPEQRSYIDNARAKLTAASGAAVASPSTGRQ